MPEVQPLHINTVAVIGAGAAGRRLALAAALAGYQTILEDLLPHALRRAEAEIRTSLDHSIAETHLSHGDADAAFRRIQYAGSIEDAARRADLVIEAVPDELDSKLEIFTLLDRICRPGTILVLTASSLTVTEIAPITFRRNRCVGMRFADAAPVVDGVPAKPGFGLSGKTQIPRIEVIRGRDTDDATLATALVLARRIAPEVIITDETAVPTRANA